MNTQTALQTATPTNRHQPVSEYIQDTVRCLVRTGGMDTAETEQIAITTLADVCRIRITQAREAWITYAAVYAATLIH